jgi:hypothetical protein
VHSTTTTAQIFIANLIETLCSRIRDSCGPLASGLEKMVSSLDRTLLSLVFQNAELRSEFLGCFQITSAKSDLLVIVPNNNIISYNMI